MKYLAVFLLMTASMLFAQQDDCDNSFALGNSWIESKRSFFGVNCMSLAINKLHNDTYPVATVNNAAVPNIALFTRISCNGFVGCWQSTTSAMYETIQYEGSNETAVYTRPVFIQTTGKSVLLTLYSVPIDTTWVEYDDKKFRKELFSEYDKYDDVMNVTLTKHFEDGLVYYKLLGTIDFAAHPIEPSALGEAMTYFFYTTGKGLMDQISKKEFEELKRLRKTKLPYYKRGAMQAMLNMYGFAVKDSKVKEGEWTFSKSEGKKWCYVYNHGDTLTFFLNIKADEKIAGQVASKMETWVKNHQFKNGVSTNVEKSGGYYWVKTICTLSEKTGEDINEDYNEAFFNDYGDAIIEKIHDVVDDVK